MKVKPFHFILEVEILKQDNNDWYEAKSKNGTGFVPKNYIKLI